MSRIDLGAKPLIFPMPVLIIGTYDKDGVPNAMNAAWGMISDMNEISISLSEHKTTENDCYRCFHCKHGNGGYGCSLRLCGY